MGGVSPRLALFAAVLAVSWGSILARLCVSGPLGVAFWRLLLSTLIVLPAALLAGRSRPAHVAPRGTTGLVLLAGTLLALHFATWIASLRWTSVGSSVLLVSTQPLFGVALSRLFLGERASARTIAAVAISLAGTAWIAWGDLAIGPRVWLGDLLALAGAAFAAGYLLIGRAVRARIPFLGYLARVYAAAAAVLGVMMLAAGDLGRSEPVRDLLWLVLMAAGPGVAGHGLLNWCVRRMRAYVVNAALLGEPLLATLYAAIVFGEAPGAHLLAGGALVVVGLLWVLREESRPGAAPSAL